MPLSEHEKRRLEEIELSLGELHPASARGTARAWLRRCSSLTWTRLAVALIGVLAGLGLLLLSVATAGGADPTLGVWGGVLILACAFYATRVLAARCGRRRGMQGGGGRGVGAGGDE